MDTKTEHAVRLSGSGTVPVDGDGDLPVVGDAELRAQVRHAQGGEEAAAQREAELEQRIAAERERLGSVHLRERVLSHLEGLIAGQPGDELRALKARDQLRSLQMQIHQGQLGHKQADGTVKDEKWFLDRGQEFIRASFDTGMENAVEENQLPGAGVPSLSGTGQRRGQRFDLDRLFGGMMRELRSSKTKIDTLDQLTGSQEADWCKRQASQGVTPKLLQASLATAKPGALAIPVPVEALAEMAFGRPDEKPEEAGQRLAENYALQDDVAEPIFQRPLLVPFQRPMDNRPWLGVNMVRADNHWTIPTLTDSHAARWVDELADIPDDSMTIGNVTTEAHRLGSRDQFSWMLEATEGGFGIRALGLAEMMKGMVQAEERATYIGSGSGNEPRGVWNYTGINTVDVDKEHNTLFDWEGVPEVLDNKNIQSGMGALLTTIAMKRRFRATLDYAGTTGALPLWRGLMSSPMGGLAAQSVEELNAHRGIFIDAYRAVASTQMPNKATASEALTGGALNATLFKLWMYVIGFTYGTAILTIDDISLAISGQTRVTINKYCDVLDRYPDSGVRIAADHSAPTA